MLTETLARELESATTPRALADVIYRHCAENGVERIDLICNEASSPARRRAAMACFVATGSADAARTLSRRIGAVLFSEREVVFAVTPSPEFVCQPFLHEGDALLPVAVNFTCV